jgi:hypothetical protein
VPKCRSRRLGWGGLGSGGVEWLLSGVLVAASAGITVYTGYLLRRLFQAEPGPADVVAGSERAGE